MAFAKRNPSQVLTGYAQTCGRVHLFSCLTRAYVFLKPDQLGHGFQAERLGASTEASAGYTDVDSHSVDSSAPQPGAAVIHMPSTSGTTVLRFSCPTLFHDLRDGYFTVYGKLG